MEKGFDWIENQGVNLYKMLKTVQISLDRTKCDGDKLIFFLQKEGVNHIMMWHKIGTHLDKKS